MNSSLREAFLWITALGGLVFLGAWHSQGLQPDAALYAGLSWKIFSTGEAWRLSGSGPLFQEFYEHPPFFFQWGSLVLKGLGTSDGAARAIGGLWGLLGFLSMTFWIGKRWGKSRALWAAFLMATFGHYTKYAATSLLEAPLSTATALAAIGLFEGLFSSHHRWRGMLLFASALALATAAKGLAGCGVWGGSLLFVLYWKRSKWRSPSTWLLVGVFAVVSLLVSLAPFVIWAWEMMDHESLEWIAGYWIHQVYASAVSNRGDTSHATHGDLLFYGKVLLKDSWPWGWSIPAFFWSQRKSRIEQDSALHTWVILATSLSLAFILPFSLSTFQLAPYIHPIYLLWAPVAAAFMEKSFSPWMLKRLPLLQQLSGRAARWSLLCVFAGTWLTYKSGLSKTPNRGQEFFQARTQVERLPVDCPIWVSSEDMDLYRMEAYALWYWKGHPWYIYSDEEELAARAQQLPHALWSPHDPEIFLYIACEKELP